MAAKESSMQEKQKQQGCKPIPWLVGRNSSSSLPCHAVDFLMIHSSTGPEAALHDLL
jgi:hypothetical protein